MGYASMPKLESLRSALPSGGAQLELPTTNDWGNFEFCRISAFVQKLGDGPVILYSYSNRRLARARARRHIVVAIMGAGARASERVPQAGRSTYVRVGRM
jgi:hypothetical protein